MKYVVCTANHPLETQALGTYRAWRPGLGRLLGDAEAALLVGDHFTATDVPPPPQEEEDAPPQEEEAPAQEEDAVPSDAPATP